VSLATQDLELVILNLEDTPGTSQAVAGAGALRCRGGSVAFEDVALSPDDLDLASETLWQEEPAGQPSIIHYRAGLALPVRRVASAGSAPEIAGLLKIHGCLETLTASTSAAYAAPAMPNAGTAFASATIRWQQAGSLVHTAHGCRAGQLVFSWQAGQHLMVTAWSVPAAWSSFTSPTYIDAGPVGPLDVYSANPVTIGGTTVMCTAYELTSRLNLAARLVGAGGSPGYGYQWPAVVGRDAAPYTLRLTVLDPAANTYHSQLASQSAGVAIAIKHGSSGGHASFAFPKARLRNVRRLGGRPVQYQYEYTLYTDSDDHTTSPWALTMAA
jgi:hypothetical protein